MSVKYCELQNFFVDGEIDFVIVSPLFWCIINVVNFDLFISTYAHIIECVILYIKRTLP